MNEAALPRRSLFALALSLGLAATVHGQIAMPDPRQMAGIPRPVTDLPNGSVSVRLIRGELSNNIADHPVELRVDDNVLTVRTDEAGRAQFDSLTPGARLKASADVDGELLASQEFPAPAQGGIRLLLVATDRTRGAGGGPVAPSAPAASGPVVIAGNSRILLEPAEDTILVYYLLDITNRAGTPVQPTTPFVFDMPSSATGCTALEGTSPLVKVAGTNVRIDGPLPPGSTFLHVACNLPGGAASFDLDQTFPAALEQIAVVVKKVGDTRLTSSQLSSQRDMRADGETYIAATGPPVPAGQALTLTLMDLPHHSSVPRWISLGLAVGIILAGVWAGTRSPADAPAMADERKRLIVRRERLFSDLIRLEHELSRGRIDQRRYSARREELISALEHVYGALDTEDAEPTDRGVAAPLRAVGAS